MQEHPEPANQRAKQTCTAGYLFRRTRKPAVPHDEMKGTAMFSHRKKSNPNSKKKSPLMLKVEEIDAKLDALSDLLTRPPRSVPQQQPQQQSQPQVNTQTQQEQGFEPFEPFSSDTPPEEADNNGQ